MTMMNPYDEVPYRSLSIEWTAPERLALASLLHGGPRQSLGSYRVLECGCGDGANLLPLAYYRRHGRFVGVDSACSQIEFANSAKSELKLLNVEFFHEDFLVADRALAGEFDYVIAHGVFSWVPDHARDALLTLCAKRLRHGGLLYVNYNAKPGWKVRGIVREFLLAHTTGIGSLRDRAERAQEVAAVLASFAELVDHPYSQLIARELHFVRDNDLSYVAHEYLTADNHSYWRSEFLELAGHFGFAYVGDADFNYSSNHIPVDFAPRLVEGKLGGPLLGDALDLLCYRQLHSAILTTVPFTRHPVGVDEFERLWVASRLMPCGKDDAGVPMFRHPSGYEVDVTADVISEGLMKLSALWPRGLVVGDIFPDVEGVAEDLTLLHRNGLIELRCGEPAAEVSVDALRELQRRKLGYFTTPYHTLEDAVGN
jgi:SAM-dependent methyltransferase